MPNESERERLQQCAFFRVYILCKLLIFSVFFHLVIAFSIHSPCTIVTKVISLNLCDLYLFVCCLLCECIYLYMCMDVWVWVCVLSVCTTEPLQQQIKIFSMHFHMFSDDIFVCLFVNEKERGKEMKIEPKKGRYRKFGSKRGQNTMRQLCTGGGGRGGWMKV